MLCEPKNCTSCGACAAVCPVDAIRMRRNEQGFYFPEIGDACIHCGKCERACPVLSPRARTDRIWPEAFVVKNKDHDVLMESASGGVFTLLARWIFRQGGCVYGAAWTEDFHIELIRAENEEQLAPMRGSKYVYSHGIQAYRDAAKQIRQGRTVLFTGVPCQIAALYGVLGKGKFPNLYTAEIACHGAGSEGVFDAYLADLQQQSGRRLTRLVHTSKKRPWTKLIQKYLEYDWADGTRTFRDYARDSYLSFFMASYCLNEACHHCPFASVPRQADLTMGDFMGYGVVHKRATPSKDGVSALWANTEKGRQLVQALQAEGKSLWEPCSLQECMMFNHALWKPSPRPGERDRFFAQFARMPYHQLAQQYFGGWRYRLVSRLKRVICRVFGAHLVACGMYWMHRRHQIPQQVEESLAVMRKKLENSSQ